MAASQNFSLPCVSAPPRLCVNISPKFKGQDAKARVAKPKRQSKTVPLTSIAGGLFHKTPPFFATLRLCAFALRIHPACFLTSLLEPVNMLVHFLNVILAFLVL